MLAPASLIACISSLSHSHQLSSTDWGCHHIPKKPSPTIFQAVLMCTQGAPSAVSSETSRLPCLHSHVHKSISCCLSKGHHNPAENKPLQSFALFSHVSEQQRCSKKGQQSSCGPWVCGVTESWNILRWKGPTRIKSPLSKQNALP